MARVRIGSADLGNPPEIVPYDPVMPRWFHTGLNSFLLNAGCDIAGAMESGYRAIGANGLANWVAVSRSRGGCYLGDPPPLNAPPAQPPFSGGQCVGVQYRVEYCITSPSGVQCFPDNSNLQQIVPGPIQSIQTFRNDTDQWISLVVAGNPPQEYRKNQSVRFPIWTDYVLNGITRLDGQPDNCGDPPAGPRPYPEGRELPPAPTPGEPFRPDEDFDFDFPDNGTNVPITVPIVNFNFNPDIGVNFNFGGVDVNISPDFGVDIGSDDGTTPEDLAPIETGIDGLESDLAELSQSLFPPISGAQSATDCSGSDLTVSWSGLGLAGLADQSQALASLIAALLGQYCPLLSPDGSPGNELSQTSLPSSSANVFHDVEIPPQARFAEVDVEGLLTAYAVRESGGNADSDYQSRFAVVSEMIGPPTERRVLWSQNQYYSGGVYPLSKGIASDRGLRVSLKASTAATVRFFG